MKNKPCKGIATWSSKVSEEPCEGEPHEGETSGE
jgi:hypothetical protein